MERHAILTRGRSGSNNLANTLNLHPEIINYGEVCGDWTLAYRLYRRSRWLHRKSASDFLEFIYSSSTFFSIGQVYSALERLRKHKSVNFKRRQRIKSIGIKDFIHVIQERGAMEYLVANKDIAIIHLYREDILRRYLSIQFLIRTGVALTEKRATAGRGKVVVERHDLLEHLEKFSRYLEEETRLLETLRDHPVLSIRFEDYFASPEATADFRKQAFEFLGVRPIEQGSSQQKMSPKNIVDMVENHAEMCEWLHGTEFEQYLD